MLPFFNYADGNHDAIREMLLHPAGVSGLSDGGAHCGMICDASHPDVPAHALGARPRTAASSCRSSTWSRSRPPTPPRCSGWATAACSRSGKKADLNVIDFDAPDAAARRGWPTTCPPAAQRLLQDADGYVATIVSGEVTRRHGVDTGARPGRLVRGAR